jgi:putative ABC transport system ATP-binding protein
LNRAFEVGEAVVEVVNATKSYKSGDSEVIALAEVTLPLRAGEVTGIVGPSGSGKTTFLMIAGVLEPPTRGEVRYRNKIIAQPNTRLNTLREFRRTHIGFVFQKANLIPFLTAIENVQVALEINGVKGRVARHRARELMDQLGIGHRINNYPSQLSGGEQQRVSIARAISNDPVLLLADEPTAALDGQRGQQVMSLFRQLADERRVAVCVVTHDPRWSNLFDQIAQMSDGRVADLRVMARETLCDPAP